MTALAPAPLVSRALPDHPLLHSTEPVCVVAAGKAAWPMVQGAAAVLGARLRAGIATGTRGEGQLPGTVQWFDGGHPVPTEASLEAADAALLVADAARRRGEPLLVLISGGASAMLAAPAAGIAIHEKQVTTEALLRAGRPIAEVNCVRRHISRIKGGQLAARAGRLLTLAISDVHVPADDPSAIGSGPTVADSTTFAEALEVVEGLTLPDAVLDHLRRGASGDLAETIKPGDPRLADSHWQVIANRLTAMTAAEYEARRLGYQVHVVRPATHGEARDAGRRFAEMALETAPLAGPMCVIGSGETTVTVRGHGRGGRNQEFVLGAAAYLAAKGEVLLASMGTDGVDGRTDAAGGVVSASTQQEASRLGMSVEDALNRNDSYTLLGALDDLIEWGPTLTNVGDIHVLLKMSA